MCVHLFGLLLKKPCYEHYHLKEEKNLLDFHCVPGAQKSLLQ